MVPLLAGSLPISEQDIVRTDKVQPGSVPGHRQEPHQYYHDKNGPFNRRVCFAHQLLQDPYPPHVVDEHLWC